MDPNAQPAAVSLNYMDSIQSSKKKYACILEPLCRQYDLTRNELDVILFLANNPGFDRAADIAAIRKIAKSHVSLSVGNLEDRGLLARQLEEGDRRTAHLKLTAAAAPIAAEGKTLQQQFFSRMFAGLSQEELELFGSVLDRVCQNIASMDV